MHLERILQGSIWAGQEPSGDSAREQAVDGSDKAAGSDRRQSISAGW